jgi:predicted nucleic acid-binding protein
LLQPLYAAKLRERFTGSEEAAKAAVSKDARRQSSQCGISCSASALVVERRGGLLKSLATEEQLFEVVARPYFASLIDPDTQAWLKKLMAAAELVTITERIVACRDPTDDKFLELPSTAMLN